MTDQPTPARSAPNQRRLREVLDACDVARLRALIVEWPELATANLDQYPEHPRGVTALSYIAMLRFDAKRLGLADSPRDTGAMAQALLDAGARVEGLPGDRETPLMTAASYGDADVAQVLIRGGADLGAVAASDAGGVPGGTPLEHAAVFGMTDVVDLLVASGAQVASLEMAAAAGDLTGWPLAEAPLEARVRALVLAADHERLEAIDALVAAGTPVDAVDPEWGGQAMRVAVENGRTASIARLRALGAAPGGPPG